MGETKEGGVSSITDSMRRFIEKYAMMNRVAVCDETNMVAEEVARELDGKILSVPSGAECLTWIIPKRWEVKEAYIETLDGKRIIDFRDNPLHLFSYSTPFNGIVKKEELESHLLYDPGHPHNIPYHYRYQYAYGEAGWGFCLAYDTYSRMNDEEYRVVIDSVIDDGIMKIADCYLKGVREETILIAAHSCHPAQVNDGLSSVAVALELFKYLKKQKNRYSYRLVIGPEFYAAAGFLAKAEHIDRIKYGVYLDMMGNSDHMGVSYSFKQNTYIDKVVRNVVRRYDRDFVGVPYREFSGNDEFFYDGPDFYIPMACIGRADYPEYHLDSDDISHCDFQKLGEFLEIVKRIVRILETDFIPVRKYRGPLYLSRYGIHKDTSVDKRGALALDKMQILMDGKNSCMEIADMLNVDYDFVYNFTRKLIEKGLGTRLSAEEPEE